MIHARIALSESVVLSVCDGVVSLEVEEVDVYSDPVEIAVRKFELVYAALGLTMEELSTYEVEQE